MTPPDLHRVKLPEDMSFEKMTSSEYEQVLKALSNKRQGLVDVLNKETDEFKKSQLQTQIAAMESDHDSISKYHKFRFGDSSKQGTREKNVGQPPPRPKKTGFVAPPGPERFKPYEDFRIPRPEGYEKPVVPPLPRPEKVRPPGNQRSWAKLWFAKAKGEDSIFTQANVVKPLSQNEQDFINHVTEPKIRKSIYDKQAVQLSLDMDVPVASKSLHLPTPESAAPLGAKAEGFYARMSGRLPSAKAVMIGGAIGAGVLSTAAIAGLIARGKTVNEKRHTNLETHGGQAFKRQHNLPYEQHSKVDPLKASVFAAGQNITSPATKEAGRSQAYGIPNHRKTNTPHSNAFMQRGGWKLHLTADPKHYAEIDEWLDNNHSGQYKLLSGGTAGEKDFTIYVGHKDEAVSFAKRLDSSIGHLLSPNKAIDEGDVLFAGQVSARYDKKSSIVDGFQKWGYGVDGIPFNQSAADNRLQLHSAYNRNDLQDIKLNEVLVHNSRHEMHQLLTKEYGEYYTGTGANVASVPAPLSLKNVIGQQASPSVKTTATSSNPTVPLNSSGPINTALTAPIKQKPKVVSGVVEAKTIPKSQAPPKVKQIINPLPGNPTPNFTPPEIKSPLTAEDLRASSTFTFHGSEQASKFAASAKEAYTKLGLTDTHFKIGAGVLGALSLFTFVKRLKKEHNSVFEESSTKESEPAHMKIAHKSEYVGSSLAYGIAAARALPSTISTLHSGTASYGQNQGILLARQQFVQHLDDNLGATLHIHGAIASAYSLVHGQNAEEKAQGFGIWAKEIAAHKLGHGVRHLFEHFLPHVYTPELGLFVQGTSSLIAGHMASPFFGWGAARAGRLMDFEASQKAERGQLEASAGTKDKVDAPDYIGNAITHTRVMAGTQKTQSSPGSVKVKTRVSDSKISKKDVDESMGRKMAYGRAF